MSRAAAIVGLVFTLGVTAGALLPRDPATPKAAALVEHRCPMHAWIVAAAPGQCTVCGMRLVRSGAAPIELCGLAAPITLSPVTVAAIGVETASVTRQPLTRMLRVAGTLEVDATRRRYLTAWADGRVDKLFVNSIGAEIRAGEPLLALFSRDLLTLQQDLLQVAPVGESAVAALHEQRVRVMQLGLTHRQLDELLLHREPSSTPVIMAPQSGTVIAKEVEEGQWVRTGDRLFEIADFSRWWFVFEVPAIDREWLRVGQQVEFVAGAATLTAPITFIDPSLHSSTRAVRARVEFEPRDGLARGAFADGRVTIETSAVLVVPRSAVLDSGAGPVAWIERGGGSYEPRPLKLGRRGDSLVEVLAGLAEGERVAVQGALLIDAQAQLARDGRR